MLSILALNVSAPPEARARDLLGWLWHEGDGDDVWVLTETSPSPGSRLIARVCRAAGFSVHVTDCSAGGGLGVMVVVRDPDLAASSVVEDVGPPSVLPGRVLPLRLGVGPGALRLLAVYGAASDPVRYSSSAQRARKREWIRAFEEWLPGWLPGWSAGWSSGWSSAGGGDAEDVGERGAVVIGDLNLVDPLHDDELRYVLPEETELLAALEGDHGLVDAYRLVDPGSREVSWVDHSGVGCRYDHAFVTEGLAGSVRECVLVHEPRLDGLSDHSALRLRLGQPGEAG
ncbi:endonuclease/exonuclease/phosphatase family protein [Ornithinimicrobium panacihumi]|uniref:endonuclease/exonuclease/phosphatase family protein n=1 Tax=Ornithinimicrobium panacihumi TaxID=2008449 RepID=UPI003F8B3DDF